MASGWCNSNTLGEHVNEAFHPEVNSPAFHAVILAGGRGTRFWPRSRRRRSKQVLAVLGPHTLIQQTVARLRPLVPPERIWVITNGHLRNEIVKQLPGVPPAQIVAEPVQRNTAPAIGLAAHMVRRRHPDAVMGVFPADHLISKEDRFVKVLQTAIAGAMQGSIIVLGIKPRWPETGYGYVQFEKRVSVTGNPKIYRVGRFREKPDLAMAKRFLKSGLHFWNSGMFVWRAQTILEALDHYLPKTAEILQEIAGGESVEKLYPLCENISIDYAVLEHARNVAGIPCEIGWNDVGSWNAVYELAQRDSAGNALRGQGYLLDSKRNYVDAPGKMVATIGVEDLIIVDTPDALLITHRDRSQDVSQIVKWLEEHRREDLL
jgi:mannose-1-phosphate guanylyltransferase